MCVCECVFVWRNRIERQINERRIRATRYFYRRKKLFLVANTDVSNGNKPNWNDYLTIYLTFQTFAEVFMFYCLLIEMYLWYRMPKCPKRRPFEHLSAYVTCFENQIASARIQLKLRPRLPSLTRLLSFDLNR